MTDNMPQSDEKIDTEAAAELDGVPEDMQDHGPSADEQIAELLSALEAAKQDVLYAQADTQNVRRRMEKEVQDARAYGATGFARDVLSIADNLARAIEAIPEELRGDEKWKGLVIGIEATRKELNNVFAKNGIVRVPAVGLPLDPNQHQAMIEIPSADHEPGTVVQEMQAGYMIRDRLLRAAMVGVAKAVD